MKRLNLISQNLAVCCLTVVLFLIALVSTSRATPYATELTNNAGTVSFTINETNDDVKIIFGSTTNDLGPLDAGSYTTNVSASNPFFVQIAKSAGAGYRAATNVGFAGKLPINRIGTNNTDRFMTRVGTPRGLAVNKNPASPFFGRIYFDNSTPNVTAWTDPNTLVVSNVARGRGLYTLKSDFSDSPNGYYTNAQTGGLVFAGATNGPAPSANSPFRLYVGEDDNIYIADFSYTNGGLFRVDGNITNGELVLAGVGNISGLVEPTDTTGPGFVPPGQNHGAIKKALAYGSIANGNLVVYTMDEDYTNDFGLNQCSIWRYDINSGPLPYAGTPTLVVDANPAVFWNWLQATMDLCKTTNGYYYGSMYREIGGGLAGLFVVDPAGNYVTDSRTLTTNAFPTATDDTLLHVYAINVTPDNSFMAAILLSSQGTFNGFPYYGNSDTYIIPLTNGIPDVANRMLLDSGDVTQGRGVDFDLAGNLYTISSGDAVLRAWSPGGRSVATTGNNGTFVLLQLPEVSVKVTTPVASEQGPVNGVFTLTRTGSTAAPLDVGYTLAGTATNGVDYNLMSGTVTFLASQTTTNVIITPIDDVIAEFTETVTLSLNVSNTYNVGAPSIGTLAIVDNETPQLIITNLSTGMYERTNDYAQFQITRLGNTNAASFNVNLSFTGTATSNVDYYVDSSVTLNPGELTKTFKIYPIADNLVEGNETIICSLAAGTGYTVGSQSTAGTVTLFDATLPPEAVVLFSDNFNVDSSASWKVVFGSITNFDDKTILWAFDYATLLGIPKAPHSTNDTLGIFINVNKLDGTPAAAAVNLYPFGQNFSGDYALRCDMYLIDALGGSATEYALFGINHSGNKTNWFRGSGGVGSTDWNFDGLFFCTETDGQASASDYALFSSPTVTNNPAFSGANPTRLAVSTLSPFTGVFKSPPWQVAGVPSNTNNSPNAIWADVEVSQISGVVTYKINNTTILTYKTNTTGYTSGNIMIGYADAFDSIGPGGIGTGAGVVFDNVRVVRAGDLKITGKTIVGSNLQLDFTDYVGLGGPYTLKSSTTVSTNSADYTTVGSATFTTNSLGVYRVTTPYDSAANAKHYYRLSR